LTTLVVHPASRPLAGSVPVPADTEIALRAIAFGALGQGTTHVAGLPHHDAIVALGRVLRALGVGIDPASASEWRIAGVGRRGLVAPSVDLDCGDSMSAMALLCGLLVGQHFRSNLTTGGSLSGADLTELVAPLRLRGGLVASLRAPHGATLGPPLAIGPLPEGRTLSPLEHEADLADPHVKTALLLSSLYADGPTIYREPHVSSDHTERMLTSLGAPIHTIGTVVRVDPAGWEGSWPAFRATVPGDLSAAAILVAAAQLGPGSRITVRGVATNPTASGFLDIARDLGAGVQIEAHGETLGEPVADLHAWCGATRAAVVGGEALERAMGDLLAACAIAALAPGTTRVRTVDAGSQALGATAALLGAFGVECTTEPDGIVMHGRAAPLSAANVDGAGDPRLAMTACVLALAAGGPSRVRNAGSIAAEFPKFVATLRALGAHIDVEP